MIAARLASSGLKFRPVSGILFRSFNSQPKESFTRRSFRSKFQEAASNASGQTVTNTRTNVNIGKNAYLRHFFHRTIINIFLHI